MFQQIYYQISFIENWQLDTDNRFTGQFAIFIFCPNLLPIFEIDATQNNAINSIKK